MSMMDSSAYLLGRKQSFNPYSAGKKLYSSGIDAPNIGPVDKLGYIERDSVAKSRRNALLKRLKAAQSGNLISSEYLTPQQGNW